MSTPFWDGAGGAGTSGADYQDNEWDRCKLQGALVPGLVQVHVDSKQRRVQNKKQNGSDGATPTFRGLDPAKVTIRVKIWTPSQFAIWEQLLPVIFPNPGKDVNKLSALDINHPATSNRGVKSIIIEDIVGPTDSQEKGAKEYVLKCWEFIQPKKKTQVKTATGSVATTDAFKPAQKGKNTPAAPSSTDFGPTPAPTPQQGAT